MEKKVIDGKLYDVNTAELLHSWDNGHYGNDFRHRSKELYRTPNGRLFIHHDGGPMTDMAKSVGNNSTAGSSDIEPVSKTDAIRFLESHGGADVIIEHFPDDVEPA